MDTRVYNLKVNPRGAEILSIPRCSNFWCRRNEHNHCTGFFSYEALIGVLEVKDSEPSILLINESYLHCSHTTSRHISRMKQYCGDNGRTIVKVVTEDECKSSYFSHVTASDLGMYHH